jgi:hypothetical protein
MIQEEKFSKEAASKIIEDIVTHQFYGGDDTIVDRVGKKKHFIKNSGELIKEYVSLMTEATDNWMENDYSQTIDKMANLLHLSKNSLIKKFVQKTMYLPAKSGALAYSLLVSLVITQLRNKVSRRVLKNPDMKEIKHDDSKFSMILNLETLEEMRKIVGERKFNLPRKDEL